MPELRLEPTDDEIRAACIAYNMEMSSQEIHSRNQPKMMRAALKAAQDVSDKRPKGR